MDLPQVGILVFALSIDISYPVVKGWEEIQSLIVIFVKRRGALIFTLFAYLFILLDVDKGRACL